MAAIKSKDSLPELAVRRLVHRLGYRFRLHVRHLPGKPDLVLARHRLVINVHGCFWHQHASSKCRARIPKSKIEYWSTKLEKNVARDRANKALLIKQGWRVLTIWECQIKDMAAVEKLIRKHLK